MKGYDSHLIIKAYNKGRKINCIAQNSEKFVSFSISHLQFIDSFAFMAESLEKLVENMPTKNVKKSFKNLSEHFNGITEYKLWLLRRKGIYPYDYIDSFDRFNETNCPAKSDFYSQLSNEDISDDDYLNVEIVWNLFKMKTLGDYHDLYLATDVLLLADVFENFRTLSMENYKLDPCHYYTAPGLAWDAMLKMTKVKLQLFDNTQIDMHLFIEQGLRGGVSMISQRYAKANNKYMESYNKNLPASHIIYLDANNLYGWAMNQKLPEKNFRWSTKRFQEKDILQMTPDQKYGYIFEVDLEYPENLHKLHNDLPLAVEQMVVNDEMLSKYCNDIKEELDINSDKVKKLVPNLNKKTKYICHYQNLKLYLQLGLKLTKVHRVLEFEQSNWLKPYIDFNSTKRSLSKSEFEKAFYKLMNNAVFGKTMENVRNRIDFHIVNNERSAEKYTARPTYKYTKYFNENLVGIELKKTEVVLDKPIIVGMSVLDLSKTLMYQFHYKTIKQKYGNKAKLLFTDTDSLCYHIETEDVYKDMQEQKDLYDFSDYPKDHFLFSNANKKVVGKFKDESNGCPITEFVGLRSKMYSFTTEDDHNSKKAKGIKKSAMHRITHQNYKNCILAGDKLQMSTFNVIRSKDHQLYSMKINKVGLCAYDNKSYLLSDGIHGLKYGSKYIKQLENEEITEKEVLELLSN